MSEILPLVGSWTPGSILGLVVVCIIFGWLVPARMVAKLLAEKDSTIAAQQRTIDVLLRNNNQLLLGNSVTVKKIDALPELSTNDRQD